MTDEQMIKEIIERRKQWGETRDSDFDWLIKQVKKWEFNLYSDFVNRINELEKEIDYLREANSINGEVNQSMNEKIKQYEKALKNISEMKHVAFDYEYIVNSFSEYAKNVLKGKFEDD